MDWESELGAAVGALASCANLNLVLRCDLSTVFRVDSPLDVRPDGCSIPAALRKVGERLAR
eukprot:5440722-Prymnesium_polylepis.1